MLTGIASKEGNGEDFVEQRFTACIARTDSI